MGFTKGKYIIVFLFTTLLLMNSFMSRISAQNSKYLSAKYYLKVNGLFSAAAGGDLNSYLTRTEKFLQNQQNLYSNFNYSISQSPFFWGGGIECGLEIAKYSFGLEVGLIQKNYSININNPDLPTAYTLEKKGYFNILPVFIVINYKLINLRTLHINTIFSGGFYFANFGEESRETFKDSLPSYINGETSTTTNFPGINAGLSVQLKLSEKIYICVEGLYRVAFFNDFSGTTQLKNDYNIFDEYYENTELYYCINHSTGEGIIISREQFEKQYDQEQWLAEKFTADLNGFSLNVGIKFIF